jgi:RNA polymerase sigma factor (sigma-70 family)
VAEANLTPTLQHLRRVIAARCDGGLSDDRLLERFAASRDEAAFEVLVWRHGPMVLGLCRRLLGRHHDAEDAMQATFLALARQAGSIGKRASLASWLFKVAYRTALRARGRAGRTAFDPTPVESLPSPQEPEPAALQELRLVVDEELRLLPEKYRTPLVLSYLEGLTNHEVAGQLGCPVGTVFTRLARGRDMLRARLVRRGVALAAGAAAFLAEGSAAAALPAALAQATTRGAAAFAAGRAAAVGTVSPGAIALAEGAMKMTALSKTASVAAVLLLLAVTAAGFLAAGAPSRQPARSAAQRLAGAAPPPRADGDGEALPDGAVARFGGVALRHAGLSAYVCLPGGKVAVSAGSDGTLRFWDLRSARQVREVRLQGKARFGWAGAFSRDGRTLAAVDGERVAFWDVDTGKEVKALPAPKGRDLLCFSPDGKTLGIWSEDMQITLYEWRLGKERRLALPPRRIGMDSTYHGHFSPDGKHVVGGGGFGEALCLFDAASGRELHRFRCNARTSLFTPDGKHLAVSCLSDGKPGSQEVLRLFDVASGREVRQLGLGTGKRYYSFAFSPDGRKLACGFSDRSCVLDAGTGRVLYRLTERPLQLSFSPDGKTLLASTSQRLRLWDAESGMEKHEMPGDLGWNPAIALSPDCRLLASADWMAMQVSVWDAQSGRLLRRLPVKGEGRYVRNLAFSGDGKTLAAAQGMGFIQFWDSATGKELRSVQLSDPLAANRPTLYFFKLHFSPDQRHVWAQERNFGAGASRRASVCGAPPTVRLSATINSKASCVTAPGGPTARRSPCSSAATWRWWRRQQGQCASASPTSRAHPWLPHPTTACSPRPGRGARWGCGKRSPARRWRAWRAGAWAISPWHRTTAAWSAPTSDSCACTTWRPARSGCAGGCPWP